MSQESVELLRRAAELGIPTPAFSSSLAYYDGLRRKRLELPEAYLSWMNSS